MAECDKIIKNVSKSALRGPACPARQKGGLPVKRFFPALMALLLLLLLAVPGAAAAGESSAAANRFNVVLVMDASGSMKTTDPQGYRFNAVNLFTDLLAESGNVLGCVVFSTGIDGGGSISPFRVDGSADKDKVLNAIRSWPNDVQNTNIGLGLEEALAQLEDYGDPNLPSVIILLSDGNTDMGRNKDAQAESIAKRDAAIKTAHDRGTPIYTVRLNVDGRADDEKGSQPNEMELISSGTGGVAMEVRDAQDLSDVFNTFYNLIYGTSTIPLTDEDATFPDNGLLETAFDVPGIGVEEVNIIIQGGAEEVTLLTPDGTVSPVNMSVNPTFTSIKLTNILPGVWTLQTRGVPGDHIKINMVYNTNLEVTAAIDAPDDSFDSASGTYDCAVPVSVTAVLSGGGKTASADADYSGYTAELIVEDAYLEPLRTVPMTVSGGRFTAEDLTFADGDVCHFRVHVTASYLDRDSETLGPVTFAERHHENESTPPAPLNTAPVPVEDPVDYSVNIWPFRDNSLSIDLTELAEDGEDSELRYKVESTTFPASDYEVEDDILTISHYSLSTGDFLIRATDSGGLYCTVTVNIKSRNIGLMALIGIGAAALVALAIVAILAYVASTKPFRGRITARSDCNGVLKNGVPRSPRRGKCKLALLGVDNIGLNPSKSCFQASGQRYVTFNTDKKVSCNGQETNRIRIESGVEVCVFLPATPTKRLYIRFDSIMKSAPHGGGHKPPKGVPVQKKNAPVSPGGSVPTGKW